MAVYRLQPDPAPGIELRCSGGECGESFSVTCRKVDGALCFVGYVEHLLEAEEMARRHVELHAVFAYQEVLKGGKGR